MKKNIWIISGEASGDMYGAKLAEALYAQVANLSIKGMGGIEMKEAGVDILVDSTELGVVGFIEVLKHIRMFLRIFNNLVEKAIAEKPDAVVLIDYPGFNLRFAKKLHSAGIKVIYYISPQVWAWGKKRIPKIAEVVDKMLVIFPFETQVYKATQLDTEFVGHPLLEILEENSDKTIERGENTVLLLPGSRRSEIDKLLYPVLDTAQVLYQRNPKLNFVLVSPRESIQKYIEDKIKKRNYSGLPLYLNHGNIEYWMQKASVGLAASGTVTVQCAILGLPLVVIYKLNPLSYMIGRCMIDIKYFTMVNLVVGKEVFQEFLQGDVQASKLSVAIEQILPKGSRREEVCQGMRTMKTKLLGGHNVFEKTALAIMDVVD